MSNRITSICNNEEAKSPEPTKRLVGTRRTVSERQNLDEKEPATICAVDETDLNPVEKAFFKQPSSPNFQIFSDK